MVGSLDGGVFVKRLAFLLCGFLATGCDTEPSSQLGFIGSGSITSDQLEEFFAHHKIDDSRAVAIKKRSLGEESYLATVHGFPNNWSVCSELIAPYNENASLSAVQGEYFCKGL